MRVSRPVVIILENVPGLKRGGQHLRCMSDLRDLGYAVRMFEICTSQLSLPHDRHRLWFVAIRVDKIRACGWSIEEWEHEMDVTMDRLLCWRTHTVTPLHEFLLSERDPELERINDGLIRRLRDGSLSASMGPGGAPMRGSVCRANKDHVEQTRGVRSSWKPHFETIFPQFLALSEREKSLLDAQNMTFPDALHN